ncbi:glycoside hydrolase family 51 protein [Botrytis cinerea T4]|uniref:non-reducing end alpha-L-arabinofuranosidase n=1 Tax=Botryotinia fuckeliana (strain T4) TaxID=999810 RepID=G2XW97_BOTF4|nr:glycoside hydrolase family 51 protein [Botrytis cinerea T4]
MGVKGLSRGLAVASFLVLSLVNAATLTVSTTGGNASSPILYGLMFEDINNSGDGGIHGQLLRNNGFQGTNPGLTAYAAVGGTNLTVDTANPLTKALPRSLKVSVPSGTTGQVGFSNAGYLGVPVNADTYANYFWIKGSYSGSVTLSLVGVASGTVYATKTITVNSVATCFTYYETTYQSTQAPDGNNVWKLTFDGAKVAGSALNFGLPQLFAVTFHKRYNGIRNDVGNFLQALEPSFFRFPGGNNIEGSSPGNRWKWNETIGPVENRPGRQGDWGYPNTDALGLMEYLQFISDAGMIPVLAVWSGLSLSGGGVVSGAALTPYVDDILDELEFLLGSTSTTWGALRESYGQAAPYDIPFIEVGNEDNLSGGCGTYASRFTAIYNAIHAAYPDITVIASTSQASCLPNPLPAGVWTDTHHYLSPNGFVSIFNEFDNKPRDGPGIFVGEYASTTDNSGATTYWSSVQGAISEAVYMIGMERNSDIVKMASYAPLFEHFDMAEWSPDLAGLNADPGSLTGSASYYVQQLFSIHRGDTILPVTSDAAFGPLYWVASSTKVGLYYVKIANYGTASQNVTVNIPGATGASSSAKLVSFTGPATASNYPLDVTLQPVTSTVTGSAAGGWTFNVAAYGVAIITVST